MRSALVNRSSLSRSLACCGRAAVTAALCVLLVEQPLLGEAPAATTHKAATGAGQISGEQRVLHALNRMTFGPRPGDAAAVARLGVDKWFEQQLNPGSIDDAAFDVRMAQYPATLMPVGELQQRYPGPFALRAMMTGRAPLPSDPVEHALAEDQIAFYAMAQANAGKLTPAQENAVLSGNTVVETAPGQAASTDGMQSGAADAAQAPVADQAAARRARRAQIAAGRAALGGADMPEAGMQGGEDKQVSAADMAAEGMAPAAGPAAVAAKARRKAQPMPQEDVKRILDLPPTERMQAVLALSPKQMVEFRTGLTPEEMTAVGEGMTPLQRETLAALPGSLRMVALEAMEARLDRDVYSNRQLEAVMTDFWLNHFNVYAGKNQNEPYLLPTYERETIRPHALGTFEDLLVATAKSPAMLVYLDNFRSDGPHSARSTRVQQAQERFGANGKLKKAATGLNENYGRELMELHTLGVNGGYTQSDVTNVSKVFTGWTLEKGYAGSAYTFDPSRHEPGSKVVLGKTIEYQPGQNGEQEGLEVLHMLATSPATARFISTKLAVRFVSDEPPTALVDRMTAAFLKNGGDIKAVLRTMFHSPEFWSPDVYRAKVKTPLEFVVSAVRAGNVQVDRTQALVQALNKLGMPLYGMQTPNGYGWKQEDWVSTGALVSRMNFSLVLSDDRIPGTRTEWTKLLGEGPGAAGVKPVAYTAAVPETAAAKEQRLEMILLGAPVSERTRATVLSQSADTSVAAQAETQFDLGGKGGGKGTKYAGRGLERDQKRLDKNGTGPDDPQAAVMAGLLLGSPEFQKR